MREIAANGGYDRAVIICRLLESKDTNFGFNAQTGEYCDMIKAGMIDPTKVMRSALQNAAAVAGLLITTEVLITEKPQPKAPGGPPQFDEMAA